MLSATWYSAEPAMLLLQSCSTLDRVIRAATATLNECRRSIISVTCGGGSTLGTVFDVSFQQHLLDGFICCQGDAPPFSPARHRPQVLLSQPVQPVQPAMDPLDGCNRWLL